MRILMIVVTLLLSNVVTADEDRDIALATCAGLHGIISTQMSGEEAELMTEVGQNYFQLLKLNLGQDGAFELMTYAVKLIQAQYNAGELTWHELINGAMSCGELVNE
jgi:hypothetical protein